MTNEQRDSLIVGLLVGAVVVYFWKDSQMAAKAKSNAASTNQPSGHADMIVSDYGNPVIVAHQGQLNTVVGWRSPAELSYHDFNQLIANPNDILRGYTPSELNMEEMRAYAYLNEIGWLSRFEEYESMLPAPKMEDSVMFALNLGSGFRLMPHPAVVTATTATTPTTTTTTP